jgi:hypothetical protein
MPFLDINFEKFFPALLKTNELCHTYNQQSCLDHFAISVAIDTVL